MLRRLRLLRYRLRFPGVRFGAGCDVRAGIRITRSPQASIAFGARCVLDRMIDIECSGNLVVGEGTIFGHHCTIGARDSISIGRDCLIAEMVSIRDHDHRFERLDLPTREQGDHVAAVTIGDNVWIGAKVTVVKGVRIGHNAVVGANAVVTRDIPANAVAAGIPARVIRTRTNPQVPA